MHELSGQLLAYLKATWRFRWYAVVFAWLAAIGGWIAVYLTPDRFEASARVYVDTQSVLRPLLSGLAVQPNVDQLVMMMSRTLITEYAWGYHFDPGTNIVDVVINHLRKKIDAKHDKKLITTVRGVGYMIRA